MMATRSEVKADVALRPVGTAHLAATFLVWVGLFGCSGEGSGPTPTISPEVITARATTTEPVVASGTQDGSTTPPEALTPTGTSLPPNVFGLETRRWPEEGDLLLGGELGAEFGSAIGDLAEGDYLLLAVEEKSAANAFSLESAATELIVRAPSDDYRRVQFAHDQAGELIGFQLFGRSWRFFDTATGESWGLGQTCSGAPPHELAPGRGWIGAMCEDFIQMEGVPFEHSVMEVLSTRNGAGMRIAIPKSLTRSERDRPYMAWLDDEGVLVSNAWVEGELRACAVTFQQATMYCPPLGLDSMISYGTYTSPKSPMIPFVDFELSRAALVPRDCFASNNVCSGPEELKIDEPRILITTSNPEIIWWIEPLGPDLTTEIGLVDLGTVTLTQLASLGGDYSFRATCPDGSCIFIFQWNSELNWRLNSDGSLKVLPFRGDVIIGSFSVP